MIDALATEIADAFERRQPIAVPPSARQEGLTLDQAYAVEAELARRRHAAGRTTVGRKVGFANKALWRVLNLKTIAWAGMYDDTVNHAATNHTSLSTSRMFAPKIEPEIMMKLRTPIRGDSDSPEDVLRALDWIALGFEIIDCPFPDWKFQPVDFVAAYGFHAALVVGTPRTIDAAAIPALADALSTFTVRLLRNGEVIEEGSGRNVLRSPALCLAELAAAASTQPGAQPLRAGEIISTGTLTTSRLIAPGETWRAEVDGLDLPAIALDVLP
jgi:2-oxo-3-hexenedioate decarboxylase